MSDQWRHELAYMEWEQERRANAECDALLARLQDAAHAKEPTHMDDVTQRAWDDWAHGIARQHCETLATVIGEETGRIRRKQEDDWHSAFDELEARVADLEARIADLEGTNTKSAPMLLLKGGRDAA
jgi:hypothetical protein